MTKRGVAGNDRVETNDFNDPLNRCPQGRQPGPAVGGHCIALRGGQDIDGAGVHEGELTEVDKRPRNPGSVYAEGLPHEWTLSASASPLNAKTRMPLAVAWLITGRASCPAVSRFV